MPPKNKIQDLFNVNGLVAVITGGGSGLGLYAARALDANGAKAVYIIGRREQTLKDAAKTAINGTIIPLVGDVTSKSSLTAIVSHIEKEQGYVNLLFANAGIPGPRLYESLKVAPSEKPTIQEFQDACWAPETSAFTDTYNVNATSVFYTTIAFLGLLDAGNKQGNLAQDSQVLVTSSIAGLNRLVSSGFAYHTSKAATNHLVKMLSTYFAKNDFRIRANVIAPGMFPSEMTSGMTATLKRFEGSGRSERAFDGSFVVPKERSALERTGSEEEWAGVVLFFASRAGAFLNGAVVPVDGGWLAQTPGSY
ncbi:NAD(P)-binding protein [Pleomassaria siparia CBS 279.74]|uniref:NAD(P)-binding protein n=1 Tax=Pleomassaria siparia CBS 279.74 TaxID=1314801 RepID=A0A6G1KAT8_9PLEO|nr:NAD(P)-binding protein [Pleomassaria siparia CBS 279.74]